jgi:hypothetical protein
MLLVVALMTVTVCALCRSTRAGRPHLRPSSRRLIEPVVLAGKASAAPSRGKVRARILELLVDPEGLLRGHSRRLSF